MVRFRSSHQPGFLAVCSAVFFLVLSAQGLESIITAEAAITSLKLVSSNLSGVKVGTKVTWYGIAKSDAPDSLVYRYSIGYDSGSIRVVRDFSEGSWFNWTPIEEGNYLVRMAVKDRLTGETREAQQEFVVQSAIENGVARVTPTSHPLVALYSAPPSEGNLIRVAYRQSSKLTWRYTPWHPCSPSKSFNVYVAGMKAYRSYLMRHEIKVGSSVSKSKTLNHTTGIPFLKFPKFMLIDPFDSLTSSREYILLQSVLTTNDLRQFSLPVATDFAGNIIWYYSNLSNIWNLGSYLVRPLSDGKMMIIMTDFINSSLTGQVLREIDLVGNTARETSVNCLNDQLLALGQPQIGLIHHEALRLPNGWTLVLGSIERVLNDVQGPGPVNILGDMLIALDEDWQVAWVWNSFDHLDTTRAAVLGEQCNGPEDGCPTLLLSNVANDWTHTNSIAYCAKDGNLMLSIRNRDWIIKIDYRDGTGSGDIIWRLGKDGDFQIDPQAADSWFSHQHQVMLYGEDEIVIFDNGNTRCKDSIQTCNSRGQSLWIDETNRKVSLILNVDIGNYSHAFGSAQKLSNGNYHFLSGIVPGPLAQSVEVTPSGAPTFVMQTGAALYRSFRLKSLY